MRSKQKSNTNVQRHVAFSGPPMVVSGVLEVLPDGYGFLRQSDAFFASRDADVYVPAGLIRRHRLTTGCEITGNCRDSRRLHAITSVDQLQPDQARERLPFSSLVPVQPNQRLCLGERNVGPRIVDLVAPIGKGQRGLIVSPPRAGKTILLQQLAAGVMENQPDCHVMIVLVDERPEEVTDVLDNLGESGCEVISSTFDQPPSNHIRTARIAIERAKRLVETGRDVVIFLDSITRLTRAHNQLSGGKLTTGGITIEALQEPKKFFGAARDTRQAGSLTILATALVGTGSKMDDFIFEEFKGTGNMEVHLARRLVEQQIWPAIDVSASGTRRDELLYHPDEFAIVSRLRKVLCQVRADEAVRRLVEKLGQTSTNAEFLIDISRSTTDQNAIG